MQGIRTYVLAAGFPIQPQFPKPQSQFHQVPHLQPLRIDADGDTLTVGADGQRKHPGGQQQQWLQRVRIVEARLAPIFVEPEGAAVRRIENAAEIRQRARAFPTRRVPECR